MDWVTALVAIALIIIAIAGLKACQSRTSEGEDDTENVVAVRAHRFADAGPQGNGFTYQ